MIFVPFIEAPDQSVALVLERRRVTLRMLYNVMIARWSLDVAIDATPMICGIRLVPGVDLLEPFGIDIGSIFVGDYEGRGAAPDYEAMISGRLRLYAIGPAERAAALAS